MNAWSPAFLYIYISCSELLANELASKFTEKMETVCLELFICTVSPSTPILTPLSCQNKLPSAEFFNVTLTTMMVMMINSVYLALAMCQVLLTFFRNLI